MPDAQVVVVGAGIAGIAAAHQLAVVHGLSDVVIVDRSPPMTEASAKSMECYRTWVPDDVLRLVLRRSVSLMKDAIGTSAHGHGLNRGYLIATESNQSLGSMTAELARTEALDGQVAGAEVVHPEELSDRYPYLGTDLAGAILLPDAGWIDAQQFGLQLFEESRRAGVTFTRSSVDSITVSGGQTKGIVNHDGELLSSGTVVNAAGVGAEQLSMSAGVRHGLISVPTYKVAIRDHRAAVPRSSPVLIWGEDQQIDWSPVEVEMIRGMGRGDLLKPLAPFCHCRPEGGPESSHVLAAWGYSGLASNETPDPLFGEVVLRGLMRMLPSLEEYRDALPETVVDGAVYTATESGRPLVGETHLPGYFTISGLGSAGIAASMGLAEVLAAAVTDTPEPPYSRQLSPTRTD